MGETQSNVRFERMTGDQIKDRFEKQESGCGGKRDARSLVETM